MVSVHGHTSVNKRLITFHPLYQNRFQLINDNS